MPSLPPTRVVDVRTVARRDRHPMVFTTLFGLAPDEAMELVVDHDPLPLRERILGDFPAEFAWSDLERGPAVWRVRITRLPGAHANGASPCCGACGGA